MPYFRHVTSGLLGLFLVSALSTLPAAEPPPAPAPAPVAVQDFKELIPDRVHPNTGGAEAMAKAAFRALTGGDFSPAK